MTPEEIRKYAETLIFNHARDVEHLTIFEMAEEHVEGGVISDEDAATATVADLITRATITITWPTTTGDTT